MLKYLTMVFLILNSYALIALADPSHEIGEPGDQQKVELLYKKTPRYCGRRS